MRSDTLAAMVYHPTLPLTGLCSRPRVRMTSMSLFYPTPSAVHAEQDESDASFAGVEPLFAGGGAAQTADATEDTGTLHVELPHWGAQVNVYDHANQLVSSAIVGDQELPPGQRYTTELSLPAGIY